MIKRGNSSRQRQIRGTRKAQMQISFGMIFSIILIIFFLGFAFYAIKVFLKTGDSAKAAKFVDEFQGDIDNIWRDSAVSSETREYSVPGYADFVCFIDFDSDSNGENNALYNIIRNSGIDYVNSNFVFYPVEFNGFESSEIRHLNLTKTTEEDNPLCLKTRNGKVSLVLKKDFGENFVTVEKTE